MTRYLTLAEYLWLAQQVTGVPAETLSKAGRIDLADSALHAPAASFGDHEFYPDVVDDAEQTMLAVASGEIDEAGLATWLRERLTFD